MTDVLISGGGIGDGVWQQIGLDRQRRAESMSMR